MIGESFHNITISIHALREEGDQIVTTNWR